MNSRYISNHISLDPVSVIELDKSTSLCTMMASLRSSSFILMSALQMLLVVAQDINGNINKVWVLEHNSHASSSSFPAYCLFPGNNS